MTQRFSGFPKGAVGFFDELELNNNREWFRTHKSDYERTCRAPMEALLAELEPKFGPGKIFRINRDTRFSANKSPYKTNIGAAFGRNYVSLSPEGLSVASGVYMPAADALARYRDAVVADDTGRKLERIAAALEKKGFQLGSHETLRSAPRGYPRDHPRVRFLRHKGVYAWKGFPPGPWLSTRQALERVKTVLNDTRSLNEWLDQVAV